jgi:hypothetical protein
VDPTLKLNHEVYSDQQARKPGLDGYGATLMQLGFVIWKPIALKGYTIRQFLN